MFDRSPVLIVDAGGTLVTRTRPGLSQRVALAARGAGDGRPEREVRAAVLTTADFDACLRALDPVSPATRAAVLAELTADPGDAVILPGADELLETATGLGWRVILATNAGPGTPPLPDTLARHLDRVVESRSYGMVKEDPRFWARLVEEEKVDTAAALVVGDDPAADRRAAEAAGLQSRLVRGDGAGTGALAAQLRAAGPRPDDAVAVVAGRRERWAGRDVISAPHLSAMVTRVTRARVRFSAGTFTGSGVLVRRSTLPPALVPSATVPPEVAWLHLPRERRPYHPPADLVAILDREGLSLDVLSPSDQRHALSLIREARSSTAASARVADLVLFLKGRRRGGDDE